MHLLVNPASRRGSADGDAVRSALVDRGCTIEVIEPAGADDVAAAIDRAGPDHVVAVGGDGLVHRALPALAHTDITLGIVPSGTGNDLARALGLPRKRAAAVERALGQTTTIDLLRAQVGGARPTLIHSVLTAGFSGRVNDAANRRSFPRGQLKYTVASVAELGRLRAVPLFGEVRTADGGGVTMVERCAFFAVANTRFFGGGMAIAPNASATDGLLHVVTVGDVPAWQLAAVLPTVFAGQHVRHPAVDQVDGVHVDIEQDESVWGDGELIGAGSVSVDVVPGALRVAAG